MDKHFVFIFLILIPLQLFSRSKVVSDSIFSSILNASRNYSVYLPPSYDEGKKYPVLYLLHGMSQTDRDWVWRGHVQDVADRLVYSGEADEMIIVMPDAGGDIYKGVWNGYFDMPGWKYETFFFEEFLP